MLGKLRFSPGSLVLVRYSTYPIWPGTIQRNTTPGYSRFVDIHPNRVGDEVVAYWVVFSGGNEGGWVSAQNIVQYHPELVYLARVSEKDGWHNDQINALRVAARHYEALHTNPRKRPLLSQTDRQHLYTLLDLYHFSNDHGDIFPMHDDQHAYDRVHQKDYQHGGNDNGTRHRNNSSVHSQEIRPVKLELSRVKGEPALMEALTYHPPASSRRATKQPKTRSKRKASHIRKAPRRSTSINRIPSKEQEIVDLRESLRRRDAQIAELNKETRRLRACRTSQLRQSVRQREEEIARLKRAKTELRTARPIASISRIPTFEQWHRSINPVSFKQAAWRLQDRYSAFCGGVQKYASALEELREARFSLADAYQDLRQQTQITEKDVVDAEKALSTFRDILKDVRFGSASDEAVNGCG